VSEVAVFGFFAVLGVFLLRAIRVPLAHRRLIRSALWSSLVWALLLLARTFDEPRLSGYFIAVLFVLVLPTGVCGWLLRLVEGGEKRGLWALKSVLWWTGVGFGLGIVVLNIFAQLVLEATSCDFECGANVVAYLAGPIGAVWGVVAGVIGAFVGAIATSPRTYPHVMTGLATIGLIPFVLIGLIENPGFGLLLLVLTVGTGAAVWFIARRIGPHHTSAAERLQPDINSAEPRYRPDISPRRTKGGDWSGW
jgi:hypothetical protein